MALSTSNINFVYSGGPSNSDPSKSLGGILSNFPIQGSVNNLFLNINSAESESGKIDYRCFYIVNDSTSDTLYNASVFIFSQNQSGSTVQLGLKQINEIQKIKIAGLVTGGNLIMNYSGNAFSVSWGGSPSSFASNLNSALVSVGLLGTTVTASGSSSLNYFSINFDGASGKRSHPLVSIVENDLTGPDVPLVTVSKEKEGEPINSIAPLLATEIVPPANVSFYDTSENNKILIGDIKPGDSFPVWIKRTTPANSEFQEADNFVFRISGNPLATI